MVWKRAAYGLLGAGFLGWGQTLLANPFLLGKWTVDENHYVITSFYSSVTNHTSYYYSQSKLETTLTVEEGLAADGSLVVRWKTNLEEKREKEGGILKGEFKELLTCHPIDSVTIYICTGLDDLLTIRLELLSATNATLRVMESKLAQADFKGIGIRHLPFLKQEVPYLKAVRGSVADPSRWRLVKEEPQGN